MTSETQVVLFVVLTMICFAAGFSLAWIRARRRVQRQLEDRLRQEMERRMSEEILRRLREGPLKHAVEEAVRDAAAEAGEDRSTQPQGSDDGKHGGGFPQA